MEASVRIGVVTVPGMLDDLEAAHAVRRAGAEAVPLWHADDDLHGVDAVVLPGGFSYGDQRRCGAVARFAPVLAEVVRLAGPAHATSPGLPVLGICTGFQVLCDVHLLPGALVRAFPPPVPGAAACRDRPVRVEAPGTVWTRRFAPGQRLVLPCTGRAGGYVADPGRPADPTGLDRLEGDGRVVARYLDVDPAAPHRAVAGVANAAGTVVGLLPHPEHAADHGPATDGLGFFTSALTALAGA